MLTIAYLVFYVLVIAVERHGFGRGPMSPIERIFIAPLLWCFAGYGLASGFVAGRFSMVDRNENPAGFWSSITFMVLFGLFCFAGEFAMLCADVENTRAAELASSSGYSGVAQRAPTAMPHRGRARPMRIQSLTQAGALREGSQPIGIAWITGPAAGNASKSA